MTGYILMCVICADAVEKLFPHLSSQERNTLLWGSTAYPFLEGDRIREQLSELRDKIDSLKERPGFWPRYDESGLLWSDVEIALSIADAEMSLCMKNPMKRQGK